MALTGQETLTECPYMQAHAVLEQARNEGARVEWVPSATSFRLAAASPTLAARVGALSGLYVLDLDSGSAETEAQRWEGLAAALPGQFRVRRDGGTLRIVDLACPTRRALVRMATTSTVGRQMLVLSASTLRDLPLPWTLTLERDPAPIERERWGATKCSFVATTSRHAYAAARAANVPAFVARELEVAALAVEVGRAYPKDIDKWLAAKRRGEWRLTHELSGALDVRGVNESQKAGLSLGEVLDALDVGLFGAELHEAKGS